jgi:hypothetical protein
LRIFPPVLSEKIRQVNNDLKLICESAEATNKGTESIVKAINTIDNDLDPIHNRLLIIVAAAKTVDSEAPSIIIEPETINSVTEIDDIATVMIYIATVMIYIVTMMIYIVALTIIIEAT